MRAPEIEWHFDAPDMQRVGHWLTAIRSGAKVAHTGERLIKDAYYDTPDWRFNRAGVALRVRKSRGRRLTTLKSFGRAEGARHERTEVSEPLPGGGENPALTLKTLTGDAGQRVRAVAGRAELSELFEVHTLRRTFDVSVGSANAEVALDTVEVIPRHGDPATMLRVEIEAGPLTWPAFEPFVRRMRKACALAPATQSKYQAGLQAAGLQPARVPDLGAPDRFSQVGPGISWAALGYITLREHVASVLANESIARLGDDIEGVHRMRVGVRRLRSAMRLFKDALPAAADALLADLRWIAGVLGAVRDADVQLELVQRWAADGKISEPAHAAARQALGRARENARARMLRVLDSVRWERIRRRLIRLLQKGPRADPRKPAGPRMWKRLRKLRQAARLSAADLAPESSDAAYHAFRIKCKRLRYAIDCGVPLTSLKRRSLVPPLVELLDVLGAHQDLLTLSIALRGPARSSVALQSVVARCAAERGILRGGFAQVLGPALRGDGWQALRDALLA